MKTKDRAGNLRTFGKFEALLRGRMLVDPSDIPSGYVLLLCGPPGAGKTTLGLYLLSVLYQQLSLHSQEGQFPALLASFVEDGNQIAKLSTLYGFNFQSASPHLVPARFSPGDEPDLDQLASKGGFRLKPGDVVFVDGISALGTDDGRHRRTQHSFIDQIKHNQLTAILVAEEFKGGEHAFLEYAADGIFRLGVDTTSSKVGSTSASRWIEITKLRWHNHYLDRHKFKLRDISARSQEPGGADEPPVVFFPSVWCLTGERLRKRTKRLSEGTWLSSGVEGFDGLIVSETGAFPVGEFALLIGPSGAGKFQFGAQFLAATRIDEAERAVCISFVRSADTLSVHLGRVKSASDNCVCHSLSLTSTDLSLEEALGAIHNLLAEGEETLAEQKQPRFTRLFIDGVSALRPRFSSSSHFDAFLRSLIDLLQTFPNLVTLMSFNTERVFQTYAEVDIPAGELFSTIVGFNFQEQFNRVVAGVVILKSSARNYDASLKVPRVVDGSYTIDPKAGWARVGLLSGAPEQVHEERPFVKLFFENRSEESVIERFFQDFKSRYPAHNHDFEMVGQHNPQPTHWSFQGYAGPGHSNTKLVQLRKYVMDELRDRKVLIDVPEDIRNRLIKQLADRYDETNFLWKDCSKSGPDTTNMIPAYADVGVLAYQFDAAVTLRHKAMEWDEPRIEKLLRNSGNDTTQDADQLPLLPQTWEDMITMARRFEPFDVSNKPIRHLFIIPNLVGDDRNFVSFFFELCWSYGWDYGAAVASGAENPIVALNSWLESSSFERACKLLMRMVRVSAENAIPDGPFAIPNPNIGGHYHEAVFARRWFSKIQQLPDEAKQRYDENKEPYLFGITRLPDVCLDVTDDGCASMNETNPGIANVDLYALGVIKDALAPEMAWMLALSLLANSVDGVRAMYKRGLPISREMFSTQWLVDRLKAPPSGSIKWAAGEARDIYSGHQNVFDSYERTLRSILLESAVDSTKRTTTRFRRTADIPKFLAVEALAAKELRKLFDTESKFVHFDRTIELVKGNISKGLEEIYPRT